MDIQDEEIEIKHEALEPDLEDYVSMKYYRRSSKIILVGDHERLYEQKIIEDYVSRRELCG